MKRKFDIRPPEPPAPPCPELLYTVPMGDVGDMALAKVNRIRQDYGLDVVVFKLSTKGATVSPKQKAGMDSIAVAWPMRRGEKSEYSMPLYADAWI